MRPLFDTLSRRFRPEDVAEMVRLEEGDRLSAAELATLEEAAQGALTRQLVNYTSMLQDFALPVGMKQQVQTARELFASASPLGDDECLDPAAVERFLRAVSVDIRKRFGASDFRGDRLNRAARREAGLDMGHRAYNKRFRLLARMERKLITLTREWQKRRFTMVGKSGLAAELRWEEFAADRASACFVAYFTARCNLRSEFTISGQQRPFDTVADMLLRRCVAAGDRSNWFAVAHVYPAPEVLARLRDEQRGLLLGRWFDILQGIAALLRRTWEASSFDRATMIVRQGNDSTTWNNAARAWNRARDNWFALLAAMGMAETIDRLCFGKVPALIAADVVAWHRSMGRGLHPDTHVWAELPPPWEVLAGERDCGRALVEEVCQRHGVDPVAGGWTAARPKGRAVEFRATPELVHGVTVGNAHLAALLRRAGVFSGKSARPIETGKHA